VDELAGGHQAGDRPDPLAGREELAVGIHAGGGLVAAEVVGAVLDRLQHLGRKPLDLPPINLVLLGVAVGDHPARLARVSPGDHRVVLVATQQRLLVAADAPGLGRGDEAGADPHAVGAQRQGGRQPPPVDDAPGGHDRHTLAHGVDHLGDQGHGGDPARVPAGLGPLGDHDVAPGLDRRHRMADLAAHVHHQQAVLVAQIDDVTRHAQARDEGAGPATDDVADLGLEPLGQSREQVDAEGPRRGLAHRRDLRPHLPVDHRGRAHAAEAPGLGHGGDELVVGHPTHSGEHHRMLDLQDVGQAGPEHATMLANLDRRVK
jgi:hypothetical protein